MDNKMSADRTLMSWTTMSISMISFGFAIYGILQGFRQSGVALPQRDTPRNIGEFLILTGTLAIGMGTFSYWQTLEQLRRLLPFRRLQPVLVTALLICAFGLFVSIDVITRMLS